MAKLVQTLKKSMSDLFNSWHHLRGGDKKKNTFMESNSNKIGEDLIGLNAWT
jgi:hypothetical protein